MQLWVISPLSDFAELIGQYFAEIWEFLMFIAGVSSAIVVLAGAVLWFTEVNASRGKGLVMSGILLAIIVQYFIYYPPPLGLG